MPTEPEPHALIDQWVRDVDAAIDRGELRMLFWTCPYPTHRGVTWHRINGGEAVPRCDTCKRWGDPR